ncbi:substrate-binding domain-containing protein [Roseinatronobacter monicus]|uniref:Tungstate transport system substrate-binding protein n=1 Tax=Roseinatronobacter monicus TaxID=393481 RepID=A0A543KA01_9RHOB|nr:substrate-binding domain-containing protein [Roseinatronobacter monicus]TQM91874.1 tungstate transport system substrate-binding protein [Roseinatronobacter monicus]
MTHVHRFMLTATFGLALLAAFPASAQQVITVASTTSTENSGLFDHILPLFQEQTGIEVRVVAQGTGQALETGRRGDVDLVFVHARAQEEAFVAKGYGVQRVDVMYNDFVLVGPGDDPAHLRDADSAADAFAAIAEAGAPFVSRGDDSGTHVAEMALWDAAEVAPQGRWYLSIGAGMGGALNMAAQLPAYVLADRGTWLSFQNRGDLDIVFEGDAGLLNPYGVILVNPARHPHVKATEAQAFIDWLISDAGQAAIASFTINGAQLFFPNAD